MLLWKWNSCMLNLFFIFQLNPCNSIMKPFFLDIVPSLVEKRMDKVQWDILSPLCEVKNCIGWWKIMFDWDISSCGCWLLLLQRTLGRAGRVNVIGLLGCGLTSKIVCAYLFFSSRQLNLRVQKNFIALKPTIIKTQQSLTGCHLFGACCVVGVAVWWAAVLTNWKTSRILISMFAGCCLTLPEGEDLDQVIVGAGRFKHRQLFEKAYRVGNLIGRWVQ